MGSELWTVSIDVGGTYTDAIGRRSDGAMVVAKVPSTPTDPAQGLAAAVVSLVGQGVPIECINLVCHGTTVATNAVLTNSLAKVALVTTEGFRDVLAYRNGSRPQVYSLTPERPHELVPRERRFELRERVSSTGEIVTPLTEEAVNRLVANVVEAEPEAVAVCLLFDFLNDLNERKVGMALRAAMPNVPITLASEIVREFREYPRMSTAVINAALRPLVSKYLKHASDALEGLGISGRLLVMQSNGGCAPVSRAQDEAHRLILSGPAGGVAGLTRLSRAHGVTHAISLDMGGTSTDVCLVRDGFVPLSTTQHIRDHQVLAPAVDIHTIGAGGGSIAWVDNTGRLRVGPDSAKAEPGPVSYSRGGKQPTLTDAHVVLGTLGAAKLAGGMTLDREAAVTALAGLGDKLGVTGMNTASVAQEIAHSIIAISVAHMVRALRKVSIERGLDPRDFTLVPFGGAGPLHAGLLVRHLQLRDALIPMRPGLFSAEGLLSAGLRLDDSQTVLRTYSKDFPREAATWFKERIVTLTEQLVSDGVDPNSVNVALMADCRYIGQGYELPTLLPGSRLPDIEALPAAFHALHMERYGHSSESEDIEVVTLRITVMGGIPTATEKTISAGNPKPAAAARLAVENVFVPGFEQSAVPVWDRNALLAGNVLRGPAIIHQMDATTLILDGQRATVTPLGDLLIEEMR